MGSPHARPPALPAPPALSERQRVEGSERQRVEGSDSRIIGAEGPALPALSDSSVVGVEGRDPSIDALRVGAMLLCIGMHAAVPYMSARVPELLWPVQPALSAVEGHAPGSWVADLVFWWGRCAQTQLFFLLAGTVSAYVLDARGPVAFAQARLRRIAVPLLAGIVFVLPLVGLIWAWGWLETGRVSWAEVRSWRFSDPEIARNALGPAHLWFLQDLLIISLIVAAWRGLSARLKGSDGSRAIRGGGAALTGLVVVGWTILFLKPNVLFEVRNTFVPDIARIAFGATFFAGGLCFARHRQMLKRWPHGLFLVCGAAAAAAMVVSLISEGDAPTARRVALASSATAAGWLTVLGGLKLVDGRAFVLPAAVQRLAASTYPLYVLHLPIVGAAQVLLYPHAPNAVLGIALVFIGSLALTWLLIEAATGIAARARTLGERVRMVPIAVWTTAAIVFGVGLRVVHYLRNPDVWHDEAALLVNVIERGYASLLTPLTYDTAAPPLFLWLERWIAVNVSDSTWVMRLLPFVASCAALVVFLPMTRVINPRMTPVAVLLMAGSIKLIGHSVEAKPYTLDVLLAAAAASAFVLTRRWSIARRATLFALVAPLVVWTSYPGVFVMGGLVGALALTKVPEFQGSKVPGFRRSGPALIALVIVIAVSFALLFAGPVRAQRSSAILENWQWAFPAASNPVAVAVWAVRSVVGIADYCFRPFGGILLIPIGIGLVALVRNGQSTLAMLLTLPIALAAVAGVIGYYPFSGSRVMAYALPALAVLAAEGLGVMLSRMPAKSILLQTTVLAVALLPPLALCTREMISPSRRPDTAAASRFVLSARGPAEMVVAGHWEYRYYLRHIRASLVFLDERALPVGQDRLWCILHGESPDARRGLLTAVVGSWYSVVRAEDLYGVSVMELSARR